MDQNKKKIRFILQYHFNTTKATTHSRLVKKNCGALVTVLFTRFRSENFNVKDKPRSGRPITEKNDKILEEIEKDRHISSHDVVYELNIHHQPV